MDRRIGGPPPRPVHHQRVVVGHIDELGADRIQHQARPAVEHAQAIIRAQIARGLRPAPQGLHRIHHLRLLIEERVAQRLRPLRVLVHALEHLRECDQRFHARVPVLALGRAHRVVAGKTGAGPGPARGFDHFERVGRCHQDLRQQRVGVERDRREHLVEFLLRKHIGGLGERAALRQRQRERGEQREKPGDQVSRERLHVYRLSSQWAPARESAIPVRFSRYP